MTYRVEVRRSKDAPRVVAYQGDSAEQAAFEFDKERRDRSVMEVSLVRWKVEGSKHSWKCLELFKRYAF